MYPTYPMPQHPQHPQGAQPWALAPAPAPTPVLPPSLEGTVLAGMLGAGAGAIITESVMYLGNFQPQRMATHAVITSMAAAFGGSAAALGHRMAAKRAYQAAQQAASLAGVNPQQAAGALRLGGKLGKFGEIELNVPTQTILDAARAWHQVTHPYTPQTIDEDYRLVANFATENAEATFVRNMPPPNTAGQPQPVQQPVYYAPQYQYPPQQPQQPQP